MSEEDAAPGAGDGSRRRDKASDVNKRLPPVTDNDVSCGESEEDEEEDDDSTMNGLMD